MRKTVHYIGLDVHKETIAVAIAPQETAEVRRYATNVAKDHATQTTARGTRL